jgi:hypothetical protein
MTKFRNIVVAAMTILAFSNITNAQTVKASYSINAEDPLKVKYIGDDGEYLVFQVTLQSTEPSKARFVIEDKNDGELYVSGMTAALKVTTVKVEKAIDGQVLNFRLVSGKNKYEKSFSVNRNLVETTSVIERDITKL